MSDRVTGGELTSKEQRDFGKKTDACSLLLFPLSYITYCTLWQIYSTFVPARKSPAKKVSGDIVRLPDGRIADSVWSISLIMTAACFVRDCLLTIVWALSSTASNRFGSAILGTLGRGTWATHWRSRFCHTSYV